MAFFTPPPSGDEVQQQQKFAVVDPSMGLGDVSGPQAVQDDRVEYADLATFVNERFTRARDARNIHETRWMESFRNYMGRYASSTKFTDTEKCQVFVKVTKTKVLAAYGQIVDVLFSGHRVPIGIQPSPDPLGIAEAVHIDPKEPPDPSQSGDSAGGGTSMGEGKGPVDLYGFDGDGRDIPPGATAESLAQSLGPLEDELKNLPVKPGPGLTPTSATFEPAAAAARKMEKKILDQLEEAEGDKHLRYTAFEAALFGTGVLFGPFTIDKEYPRWSDEGEYTPVTKKVPRVEADSIWNFYPDPDAKTPGECEYFVRRRKMSRSQLRALKRRPFFRGEVINQLIAEGPNYIPEYWEAELASDASQQTDIERWDVREFWGLVDTEIAEDAGLPIPKELRDHEQLQATVWVSGGHVIRLVLNPFLPVRLPAFVVPLELNPYSIFGVGVAENMADTQLLMNGFMRMAVDNGVLSGNLVWEVDETLLSPGQDLKVFPGKVFRRNAGAPGQAIFAQKFPNTTQENLMMFDKARQLADEATGIPSFSHGQTGVTGIGRTAAGISMLMGAASISVKTIIKNFDDYLLMPMGKSLFAWNMQFEFDKDIKGDLEVVARGTTSLLKNEVRQQRLMTFLQVVSNPALAPFAKFSYIIREIATVLELDPDKVCNSPEEAIRQAQLMQLTGAGGGQAGGAPGGPPAPPGANAADPTGAGGGTIGTGSAPTPGEPAFTGNPQPPPAAAGAVA